MTGIPIYQFCRAFENVRWSDVYQCYVSGGYAFEKITRWNQEVPKEIRQAVINGYFALNDNYPPEEEDFALIAREIDDKYAVLAVANRQLDDGGRPTIGYKYFWLEKLRLSQYVDGIGTLIYWWNEQNQPKFDMAELVEQSEPGILYYDQEIQKRNFQATLEYVQALNKIPEIQVVKKEIWQETYPAYMELHYLALGLSFRVNYFNAWAWNVQKLAHSEKFLAIFYATQEYIPNNLRKRPLPSVQKDNSDPNSHNTSTIETTQNSAQIVPVQKIKNCLMDIARIFADTNTLNYKKTEELFEYLTKFSNENWSDFINQRTLSSPSSNFTKVYKAEIYLLLPKERYSLLTETLNSINIDNPQGNPFNRFMNFGHSSTESGHNNIAIEFQTQLLKACFKYQNTLVIQRLISSIYTGISYLLNQLMTDNMRKEQIEFLLTESQSVWSQYFLTATELVKKRIFFEEETIVEESLENFCQEILIALQKPQHIPLERKRQYENLASIFLKVNYYSLAGTCYYISNKFIPPNIRQEIPNEILRKIQNIKPQKPNMGLDFQINNERQNNDNQDNESKSHETINRESQNNEKQDSDSQEPETTNNEAKNKEPQNKKPKSSLIINNNNERHDNRQAYIWLMIFLAGSGFFKIWKNLPLPPKIILHIVNFLYFLLSIMVLYFTLDDFFLRRTHRFSRIIGSSLAIFYIFIFAALVLEIERIPKFTLSFGTTDKAELDKKDIHKSASKNDVSDKNLKSTPANSSTPSSSSISSDCSTNVLSDLSVFKKCDQTDQEKLNVALRDEYKLFSTEIAENLRQFYLKSENETQFQEKKSNIHQCQNDNPITNNPNDRDNLNSCIQDVIQKYTQPKNQQPNNSKS
jgi:hypothetical protein